jgi:branched-chain amino acid transport system substrate-binding protein
MIVPAPWHTEISPNRAFSRQSIQLWGGPVNWRTAMSYDATQAIATGLQRAASLLQPKPTRDGLKEVLRSTDFSLTGASGTIRFIQSGERQIIPGIGVIVQVQPDPKSKVGFDFIPVKKGGSK